jgi:transcriptional activator SPT8
MDDGEDLEPDVDQDGEAEGDDDDNEDDNGDDDQDEDDDSPDQPLSQIRRPSLPTTNTSSGDSPIINQSNGVGPTSHPRPTVTRTSASPRQASVHPQAPRMRFEVRPEALTAPTYDQCDNSDTGYEILVHGGVRLLCAEI